MKQWQAYKTRCRSVAVSLLGWLLVATMSCQGGRNIRSTEDTPTESVVQDPQQPGKIYVLLIGINRYKNPGIYPLDYTDRDVWALRSSLIRYAKVPAGHIQVLLNEQARRTDIVRALDLLKTRVSKEDTVLLYFSGHGVWMKDTDMSYLAPHDMNQSDVPGTALDHDTLNAKLHNLQAQQIVILLDACHSGYSVKGVRFTPTGTFSASSFKGKGRVVIASSRLSQGSLEDDKKKHGVFTVALLEALSGKADSNGDGRVTMLEACDYVQERTHWLSAALIKRRDDLKKHGISPQKPVCKIDVSGRIYLSHPGRSKARLKVVTSPPGATVRIGGYHVGTTPYEADQEPGDKSVEVQLSGHKVWRERIQLQPRQTRTLQVTLEKVWKVKASKMTTQNYPSTLIYTVDGWKVKASKMTTQEKLKNVGDVVTKARAIYNSLVEKLRIARSTRDLISLDCLEEKFSRVQALMFLMEKERSEYLKTTAEGKSDVADDHFVRLMHTFGALQDIQVEADQCARWKISK